MNEVSAVVGRALVTQQQLTYQSSFGCYVECPNTADMRVYFTQQQATQAADQLNLAGDGNQHNQTVVQLQTSGFGAVGGEWRVI